MKDMFVFPHWGNGVFKVWIRNFLYFKQTLWVSFFWITLEPVIILLAIGYGLGGLIEEVNGQSYIEFYAPGAMVGTGMLVAFYESTYGSYTRFSRQKTFSTMLLTPLTANEIFMGEIAWGMSKGFLSSLSVGLVGSMFGVIDISLLHFALPILVLNCWFFSALGMLMSAYAKSFDSFLYSQSALITPMYLFCGVFYPLDQLPLIFQKVAMLLPLTHSSMAVRDVLGGVFPSSLFLNIAVLFLSAFLISNWAIAKFSRRLAS